MAGVPALMLSRADLAFLLYEWLDVETLAGRERYAQHSRATFDAALELSERVAGDHFAPHNRASDLNEPVLDGGEVVIIPEVKAALDVFGRTGLLGASMDERVGGMQLPHTVTTACFAWFQAANIATSAYPFLTVANANLLLAHGNAEQIATYVRPMVDGRFFGTMCLSEPQAGSSLADIVTRAEPQEDGTFRLTGNKMWISGGDHDLSENIIHLVLAKIPGGPPGVKGISLFIVPRFLVERGGSLGERNDVVVAGLNHKMGYRGTVNTLLNFGEGVYLPGGARGAIGYLVGEPNRGLAYMFHMMNEARVGIGVGATALGSAAYLKSLRYARERTQGRPVVDRDPSSPQTPIIEHADVRRMLLAQKSYVEGAMALVLYCSRLVDDEETAASEQERNRAHVLLELLTPIAKSWPAQWCLAANDLAIQIHGGYGYTRDFDVEQHYRDNRLNAIHEGTSGIQALDLLGRKVVQGDGAGLRVWADTAGATVTRARALGGESAVLAGTVAAAIDRLVAATRSVWAAGDAEAILAQATAYIEAMGHIVIAWLWLEQWLAADGRSGHFYDGKRQAARYFISCELPRTGPLLDVVERLDRTALDMRDPWF
jgi:alkylation response protein AidB-like acyl-CoA dehydrogenase